MSLPTGTRLGAYEVIAQIGAGGMGEVYRARDTQLSRDVAIKVLPATLVADAERAARFDREAQVLAALNHPNIAAIYGVERHAGPEGTSSRALILEFVDGPTLGDLISQSRLPMDDAIAIAKQIALALESAHDQGIIHRDLKPANIKVRPDGTVKVLDFGLAKAVEVVGRVDAPGRASASMSPTLTAATQIGMILGTAAYMAPEQARGKSVDKRADVWAFGCVLYEMLTSRRAFDGDEVSDTLAFIITKEIDWSALPAATPPHVRRVLRRCLEKDLSKRLRDIGDARLELDTPGESTADPIQAQPVATATRGRRPIEIGAAALAGMSIAGAAVWLLTRPVRVAPPPLQRFPITLPASAPYVGEVGGELAVSPDGSTLVYVGVESGKRQLYQRRLDQLDPQPIRGTDDAYNPFFSPDGEWIGYFTAGGTPNGRLKKVSIRGGPSLTLGPDTSNPSGTWTRDDRIIFTRPDAERGYGLYIVPAAGGTATKLTTPDVSRNELRHSFPEVLPDGKTVLFSVTSASFEDASIAALSLDTGKYHTVVPQGYHARYVATGHLVYILGGNLMAVPFDVTRVQTTGPPVPIVEAVRGRQQTAEAAFAVSSTGTLFYGVGGARSLAHQLVWVDRKGHEEPTGAPTRSYLFPRISPDGTQVAMDIRDQKYDIWIWNFSRRTLTTLTSDPAIDSFPVWSSDGRRVFFSSGRASGTAAMYVQAADGTGKVERLVESSAIQAPNSASADGKFLLFQETGARTRTDLWMLSLADRRATPLVQTPATELNVELSPDGRWIAYQSDESGQNQIYVRPFPAIDSGRWQVSATGGTRPVWARNGRELFYVIAQESNLQLMAVPIQPGSAFSTGSSTLLFSGPYAPPTAFLGRTYDVSPDGQRFLMINTQGAATQAAGPTFVAVVNWTSELPRLAPKK